MLRKLSTIISGESFTYKVKNETIQVYIYRKKFSLGFNIYLRFNYLFQLKFLITKKAFMLEIIFHSTNSRSSEIDFVFVCGLSQFFAFWRNYKFDFKNKTFYHPFDEGNKKKIN